jgi:hypothetical protein
VVLLVWWFDWLAIGSDGADVGPRDIVGTRQQCLAHRNPRQRRVHKRQRRDIVGARRPAHESIRDPKGKGAGCAHWYAVATGPRRVRRAQLLRRQGLDVEVTDDDILNRGRACIKICEREYR